jgi:diadenosine tetraphosphate (Ap4A) HIT family hydrolase
VSKRAEHLRLVDDDPRSEVEKAFAPTWNEDVYVLARLWRWLCFRDLRPAHPDYFMAHALDYSSEYEAMTAPRQKKESALADVMDLVGEALEAKGLSGDFVMSGQWEDVTE